MIVQSRKPLRCQPREQLNLTLGSPAGAAGVLDVVDAKRISQDFLTETGVVRGVAEHGIKVHGKHVELGIAAHIEPVLPSHQSEIAAAVGVQEYGWLYFLWSFRAEAV